MNKTSQNIPTLDGGNTIRIWAVNQELSILLGQVLTIIDASVEGEKNQAIKSLIKERFSDKQNFFESLYLKNEESEGCGHSPAQFWEEYLVPEKVKKSYSFRA